MDLVDHLDVNKNTTTTTTTTTTMLPDPLDRNIGTIVLLEGSASEFLFISKTGNFSVVDTISEKGGAH